MMTCRIQWRCLGLLVIAAACSDPAADNTERASAPEIETQPTEERQVNADLVTAQRMPRGFRTACEDSPFVPAEACGCIYKQAKNQLTEEELGAIVVALRGDDEVTDKAMNSLPVDAVIRVSNFSESALATCAE